MKEEGTVLPSFLYKKTVPVEPLTNNYYGGEMLHMTVKKRTLFLGDKGDK
jgi:hypothetical protein